MEAKRKGFEMDLDTLATVIKGTNIEGARFMDDQIILDGMTPKMAFTMGYHSGFKAGIAINDE